MKMMFVGPPGAGKGTQATAIAARLCIPHISTGDMLREEIKNGTTLGTQAKAYIEVGDLVPDDVIIGMVKERIARPDSKKGFILDGFPRTVAQAQVLDGITKLDVVFNIDVPDEALIKRICARRLCRECGAVFQVSKLDGAKSCLKCGGTLYIRPDDNEETVRQRISVYKQKTAPLIAYYKKQGILKDVRDSVNIEAITQDIMGMLADIE